MMVMTPRLYVIQPSSASDRATSLTDVRRTASIWARKCCVSSKLELSIRSAVMSSQRSLVQIRQQGGQRRLVQAVQDEVAACRTRVGAYEELLCRAVGFVDGP
jgi:hypothetical protein